MSKVLKLWKEDLKAVSVKAAESLADPNDYEELFPALQPALKLERWAAHCRAAGVVPVPSASAAASAPTSTSPSPFPYPLAASYVDVKDAVYRDWLSEVKEGKFVVPDAKSLLTPKPEPPVVRALCVCIVSFFFKLSFFFFPLFLPSFRLVFF